MACKRGRVCESMNRSKGIAGHCIQRTYYKTVAEQDMKLICLENEHTHIIGLVAHPPSQLNEHFLQTQRCLLLIQDSTMCARTWYLSVWLVFALAVLYCHVTFFSVLFSLLTSIFACLIHTGIAQTQHTPNMAVWPCSTRPLLVLLNIQQFCSSDIRRKKNTKS